jgi:hypothetical protein
MARARKWMQAATLVITALTLVAVISIFISGAKWRAPDCRTVTQLTKYTSDTTYRLNSGYLGENPPTGHDFQDWADTIQQKYVKQLTDPRYQQLGQTLVADSRAIADLASAPTDPLPVVGGNSPTWMRNYDALRAEFDFNLDLLNHDACQTKYRILSKAAFCAGSSWARHLARLDHTRNPCTD